MTIFSKLWMKGKFLSLRKESMKNLQLTSSLIIKVWMLSPKIKVRLSFYHIYSTEHWRFQPMQKARQDKWYQNWNRRSECHQHSQMTELSVENPTSIYLLENALEAKCVLSRVVGSRPIIKIQFYLYTWIEQLKLK